MIGLRGNSGSGTVRPMRGLTCPYAAARRSLTNSHTVVKIIAISMQDMQRPSGSRRVPALSVKLMTINVSPLWVCVFSNQKLSHGSVSNTRPAPQRRIHERNRTRGL